MASVEQRPVAVERPASEEGPRPVLFNPRTYDPADFDEATRRALLATIEFFESRGKATLKEHDHERTWYADFLEFVKRERVFATLLTPAARGGRRPRQALGHRAHLRASTRSSASTGSPTGTRGRSRSSGSARSGRATTPPPARRAARAARGRRDLRVRPLRAGARRRHLLDRHGPRRPTATAASRASGSKYYIGNGNLAGHGLGLRPPRRRRGPGRLRLLRRRQPAPRATSSSRTSSTRRTTSASSALEDYPVASRGRPAHRPGRLRRRAEHGQRRQVQPRLRLDRDLRARLLRGDHPRRRPRPLRPAR